jgi:hypothetical protein
MEGGDLYNMFKTANRKVLKNFAVPMLDTAATIGPLLIGQPELIPFTLAGAHTMGSFGKEALLPAYGKNKKRIAKLEEEKKREERKKEIEDRFQQYRYNNFSSYNNMPYRHYNSGGGLNAPRSRLGGYDMTSSLAKASLGHAQANSMLGKLESHMAQARQHNQGLIGVSGTLINQIPPLQSQPQQNFQFRSTLITPAYRPTVFGQ